MDIMSKKSPAELKELRKRNRIRDRSPVGTAVIYAVALLLAFIALAAYWRVPRATVRTFQPVESPVTSPLAALST